MKVVIVQTDGKLALHPHLAATLRLDQEKPSPSHHPSTPHHLEHHRPASLPRPHRPHPPASSFDQHPQATHPNPESHPVSPSSRKYSLPLPPYAHPVHNPEQIYPPHALPASTYRHFYAHPSSRDALSGA